jgi:anti-sigma-K factor RskA
VPDTDNLMKQMVEEWAQRLKAFDDAYPDVGMPPGIRVFREEALKELKELGYIPQNWELPK